jgi:hypothetical protein
MPKKSAHKKKAKPAKKIYERHFLWSIFFIAVTAALNIYFVGDARIMGDSYTWPLVGTLTTIATLLVLGYERKTGKLGSGKYMWSIFFAALTLAVSLYITSLQNYSSWSVMAAGASVIALTLLIYEKYNG